MHFINILPIFSAVASTVTVATASTYCNPVLAAAKYPNKCQIFQVFHHLNEGNFPAFFANVASDVEWTLTGTHPLAGVYHNRTFFIADAIELLANVLKSGGTANLLSIVGGGDEEWSVQEIHALDVYLKYNNVFSWAMRWSTEGIIVQVRAFFDSHLVTRAITGNESPAYVYIDQRIALEPGPVALAAQLRGSYGCAG